MIVGDDDVFEENSLACRVLRRPAKKQKRLCRTYGDTPNTMVGDDVLGVPQKNKKGCVARMATQTKKNPIVETN